MLQILIDAENGSPYVQANKKATDIHMHKDSR